MLCTSGFVDDVMETWTVPGLLMNYDSILTSHLTTLVMGLARRLLATE